MKLEHAALEELTAIPEIGPVMAEAVTEFFSQVSVKKVILELQNAGVNMVQPKREIPVSKISGKTFVLTGELETFSRSEAEAKIIELGGNATSSVSKKTDYLVLGKDPGSKYDKAKKLGVKIIDENEFKELIKQ
jgi:DNA ligase (NAD+)